MRISRAIKIINFGNKNHDANGWRRLNEWVAMVPFAFRRCNCAGCSCSQENGLDAFVFGDAHAIRTTLFILSIPNTRTGSSFDMFPYSANIKKNWQLYVVFGCLFISPIFHEEPTTKITVIFGARQKCHRFVAFFSLLIVCIIWKWIFE